MSLNVKGLACCQKNDSCQSGQIRLCFASKICSEPFLWYVVRESVEQSGRVELKATNDQADQRRLPSSLSALIDRFMNISSAARCPEQAIFQEIKGQPSIANRL